MDRSGKAVIGNDWFQIAVWQHCGSNRNATTVSALNSKQEKHPKKSANNLNKFVSKFHPTRKRKES